MEGGANEVFERVLDPFRPRTPLAENESMRIALYLAFQLLRTPRHRREIELMGDYLIRAQHRGMRGINELRVLPDPNLHLEYMTKTVFKMSEAFFARPSMLVTIDRPLFITADEPVILLTDGDETHVRHTPNCLKNLKQRRKDARRPSRRRRRNMDVLHVYPARPGVLQAVEVALPLTPRALFVLGPPGARGSLQRAVTGDEASALADDVNRRLVEHAFEWVAAHPGHELFRDMPFPPPGAIVRVCDGGTPMARDLDQPPTPRRPTLLGRDWQ